MRINVSKTKQRLIFGFGLILSVLVFLTLVWIANIKNNADGVAKINQFQQENVHIFQILNIVHNTKELTYSLTSDHSRETVSYSTTELNQLLTKLLEVKNHYESLDLHTDERMYWKKTSKHLNDWIDYINFRVESANNSDFTTPVGEQLYELEASYPKLVEELNSALNHHIDESQSTVNLLAQYTKNSIIFVSVLGSIIFLLLLYISKKIIVAVGRSEAALENAKQVEKDANNAKSAFLANMSHEIRTPLTSIMGFSDALKEVDISDEYRDDAIDMIKRNSDHLLHIINEVLDISKIESQRLNIEKVSFSPIQLIEEVIRSVEGSGKDRNLKLRFKYDSTIPNFINNDATRIRQIIFNLLSNAIKFSKDGEIILYATYAQQENQLTIKVEDCGIGIANECLEEIFKPFTQADVSTTRKFGGTGLGLTISRQLSRLMGGDLSVESEEGKGSIFTLTFDSGLNKLDKCIQIETPTQTDTFSNNITPTLVGNILVAEDNADTQKLIELLIKRTGASCTIVNNGKDAIEEALSKHYDLILLDIQMPVFDGIEAAQWIQKTGNTTPIVAFTANATETGKKQYQDIGMKDVIAKPIDKDTFYATLSRYIQKKEHSKSDVALENDQEFLTMKRNFISNLEHYEKDVTKAIQSKDFSQLRSVTHKLKGIGGSYGFNKLSSIAAILENLALNQDSRGISKIHKDFIAECQTAQKYLGAK